MTDKIFSNSFLCSVGENSVGEKLSNIFTIKKEKENKVCLLVLHINYYV